MGKNTVVAPKTRLAVGVVFIGALIYSMVWLPTWLKRFKTISAID